MWNYVNVSVRGISHQEADIPCQDKNSCSIVESDSYQNLVIAVSDGAGSAVKADTGASLICQKFTDHIKNSLQAGAVVKDFNRDFFKDWLVSFQEELNATAEADGLRLRDYACTFLGVVLGENFACFAQIGDGAIVFKNEENKYLLGFLPQQGQFINQTFFATEENAAAQLDYLYLEKQIDELAVFTDGIQSLVIDFKDHCVNEDFFSQWFQWLRELDDREMGNYALETYLNSPKITERTDDDKTLILAIKAHTNKI